MVSEALEGAGALAVTFADPGGTPILEPEPGTAPLWAQLVLSAIFEADTDVAALRDIVAASAGSLPDDFSISFLRERNWAAEFRERLQPLRFGHRLWICPSGMSCPDPEGIVIELEPGLAFGSGSHPSTQLCLEWLAGLELAGSRLLDFGCGSGVLSIAALKLGAAHVTALDIDPQALQATADNAARNNCGERLEIASSETFLKGQHFDIIVANILADTLLDRARLFASLGRSGTRIALSGILSDQSTRVCEGFAHWFDLEPSAERDGWALLSGRSVGDC